MLNIGSQHTFKLVFQSVNARLVIYIEKGNGPTVIVQEDPYSCREEFQRQFYCHEVSYTILVILFALQHPASTIERLITPFYTILEHTQAPAVIVSHIHLPVMFSFLETLRSHHRLALKSICRDWKILRLILIDYRFLILNVELWMSCVWVQSHLHWSPWGTKNRD